MIKFYPSNKKAFFFTTDLIIALVILVMGVSFILIAYASSESTTQASKTATDFVTQLAYTPLNEQTNPALLSLWGANPSLFGQGEKSLLYYIVYLNETNNNKLARNMLQVLSDAYIPTNYNLNVTINQTAFFNDTRKIVSQDDAPFVLTQKVLVYQIREDTKIMGPYVVQVAIW